MLLLVWIERTLDDPANEWVMAEEHIDTIDEDAIVEEEQEEAGAREAEGRPERTRGKMQVTSAYSKHDKIFKG